MTDVIPIHRTAPGQKPGRSRQDYPTPPEFVRAVEKRFGFEMTIDLAADEENTKAEYYLDAARDSLSCDWADEIGKHGHAWLNPPFGLIEPWADKCAQTVDEIRLREATTAPDDRSTMAIYLLIPASVGSNWFHRHVHGRAEVYFLRPRLSFDGKSPYPKDLILARYAPDAKPKYATWRWDR